MASRTVAEELARGGFDLFAGVPCSLIEGVIAELERRPGAPWIPAAREDLAVGVAAGAWLAGRRPAILMQNSGLGTAFNALASLSVLYGLPALLVITWRGWRGQDAPEHLLMGEVTPRLLDLLGIPCRILEPGSLARDLAWARQTMEERPRPVALLAPEGSLAPLAPPPRSSPMVVGGLEGREALAGYQAWPLRPTISRAEGIAAVLKTLDDQAVVIAANGYPSREACAIADRPRSFYMIGSMGLAASIGLGVALARPATRVVVLDGDGNLLMALGVLANVAALAPANLIHCVLDNEAYGSTGNQRSVAAEVRLDRLAAAAGYRTVTAVDRAPDVGEAVRAALGTPGPHFVLVKVTTEAGAVPRVPHAPAALRDRFRAAVTGA